MCELLESDLFFSNDNIADSVLCARAVQYKLGRGNRDKVQQFMAITGARFGCLIAVEFDFTGGP